MRILHVTTEFPPIIFGGLGTAVGGLVNASARSGMTVAVLLVGGVLAVDGEWTYGQPVPTNYSPDDRLKGFDGPEGVTFFQISPLDSVQAAVRVAKEWGAEVLHLHTAWVWPFARAILEQIGIPLVYTVHSVDRAEYEIGMELGHILEHREEQEIAIAHAERLIALTENETELLTHYYPEAQKKIRIVGNGVDDCLKARTAARKETKEESPLVLYSGRLVERKGIRDLLAAVPYVLERAPQTRFVLAGGPPPFTGDQVALQWLPPECYPYRSRIHFTGWLSPEDLQEWYSVADIQVVPSRYEPFGMVVLEGMLYGLPIVAADVGGPREILVHGRTGLLFPPTDVKALGESILTLVRNLNLRRRIGVTAAREVRRNWLWPRMVEKMRSVYAETEDTQSCNRAS